MQRARASEGVDATAQNRNLKQHRMPQQRQQRHPLKRSARHHCAGERDGACAVAQYRCAFARSGSCEQPAGGEKKDNASSVGARARPLQTLESSRSSRLCVSRLRGLRRHVRGIGAGYPLPGRRVETEQARLASPQPFECEPFGAPGASELKKSMLVRS